MIAVSMIKIMEQIKEIDPTFEFITEKDIEECKKEDPNFELTEEDLREALAYRKLLPEMEKIAQMHDNYVENNDNSAETDFIIKEE